MHASLQQGLHGVELPFLFVGLLLQLSDLKPPAAATDHLLAVSGNAVVSAFGLNCMRKTLSVR